MLVGFGAIFYFPLHILLRDGVCLPSRPPSPLTVGKGEGGGETCKMIQLDDGDFVPLGKMKTAQQQPAVLCMKCNKRAVPCCLLWNEAVDNFCLVSGIQVGLLLYSVSLPQEGCINE